MRGLLAGSLVGVFGLALFWSGELWALGVVLEPARPSAGDPVRFEFRARAEEAPPAWLQVDDFVVPVMKVDTEVYQAVFPLPREAASQKKFTVHDVESQVVFSGVFALVPTTWPTSELEVSRRFTQKKSRALRRRLRREARSLREVRGRRPSRLRLEGRALWPVFGGVTSPFGVERRFNGELRSVHYGLDLDGSVGVAVRSAHAGVVQMVEARFVSGNTVIVDHGGGVLTAYYHLSQARVAVGDRVRAGQVLGDVGSTGRVTGPHLHLAVLVQGLRASRRRAGFRWRYVNPETFLSLRFAPTRVSAQRSAS